MSIGKSYREMELMKKVMFLGLVMASLVLGGCQNDKSSGSQGGAPGGSSGGSSGSGTSGGSPGGGSSGGSTGGGGER
jgi:hypothetical protein